MAAAESPAAAHTSRLPSRRNVLVDLAALQHELLVEGKLDQASRIGRAVLTMAELLSRCEQLQQP